MWFLGLILTGIATSWSFLSGVLLKMTVTFLLPPTGLCYSPLCCCSDMHGKLCLSAASCILYSSFVLWLFSMVLVLCTEMLFEEKVLIYVSVSFKELSKFILKKIFGTFSPQFALVFLGLCPLREKSDPSFPSPLCFRIVDLGLQPRVVKECVNEDFQHPEKTVKRKNRFKSWEGGFTMVPHERAGYHKEGIPWICISCLSLWGLGSTVGEQICVGHCLMVTPNGDAELC